MTAGCLRPTIHNRNLY